MPVHYGPTLVDVPDFKIGSSYAGYQTGTGITGILPNDTLNYIPWQLGEQLGPDIEIDGGDDTLINILKDGFYQVAAYAVLQSEVAAVDWFAAQFPYSPASPGDAPITGFGSSWELGPDGTGSLANVFAPGLVRLLAGVSFRVGIAAHSADMANTWSIGSDATLSIIRLA